MSMPSTEIKSISEVVKERLQGQIAGLIPEEALNTMLEQATEGMLRHGTTHGKITSAIHQGEQYYNKPKVSLVQSIVEEFVYDEFVKRIKETIATPEMQSTYDGMKLKPTELVDAVVKANSDLLMKSFFSAMIGSQLQTSIYAVEQELNQRGIYK
jgi:hypothetical protein